MLPSTGGTVLVTGATGFLGSFVVKELLKRGTYDVACLVRPTSDSSILPEDRVSLRYGNLDDESTVTAALRGCQLLVNVASLGFGHGPGIVRACVQARVSRAVFLSTTAIFTSIDASSKSVRVAAEEAIAASGLASTILRPTMIYGTTRDRNISRLVSFLHRCPLIPIPGDGQSLQQPVHVADLAGAVADVLQSDRTRGKSYAVPGKEPISYNSMIDTIGNHLNKKIIRLHLPLGACVAGLKVYGLLSRNPRLSVEQVRRLNEDKQFDYREATADFGFSPRSFEEGIAPLIRRISASKGTPNDERSDGRVSDPC